MESLQNFVQNFYLCRIKRNLPNMNLLQILHKTVVRIRKKNSTKNGVATKFCANFYLCSFRIIYPNWVATIFCANIRSFKSFQIWKQFRFVPSFDYWKKVNIPNLVMWINCKVLTIPCPLKKCVFFVFSRILIQAISKEAFVFSCIFFSHKIFLQFSTCLNFSIKKFYLDRSFFALLQMG